MTTPTLFRKKYVKTPLTPQTFQSTASSSQHSSSNGMDSDGSSDISTGGLSNTTSSTSSNGHPQDLNHQDDVGGKHLERENRNDDEEATSVNVMGCLRNNVGVGGAVSGAITTVAKGGVTVMKEGGNIAKDVAKTTGQGVKKLASNGYNAVDQTARGILRRPRSHEEKDDDIDDKNSSSNGDSNEGIKQIHFSNSIEAKLATNTRTLSPIKKEEEDIHIAAEKFVKRYSVDNDENTPESTRLAASLGDLSIISESESLLLTSNNTTSGEIRMLYFMGALTLVLTSYQNFQVTVVGHVSPWMWLVSVILAFALGRHQAQSSANETLQQSKRKIQWMEERIKKLKLSSIRKSDAMKRESFLSHTASMISGKEVDETNEPNAALPETVDPRLPQGFYSVLQMKDDNIFKGGMKPSIAPFLMKRLLDKPTVGRNADGTAAVPLCHWIGTDYLLTESAEDPVHKNRYLNRVGLRDKPMMIINAVLPWANIVMYYVMPDWVKNFDEMTINDDDSEEIQCFKKFLMGDDEYRYLRLQFLPYLVEGPVAMKMVAPPKRELIGRATLMPKFSWYKKNETPSTTLYKKQCALIECSVDLSQSALCRSLSRIIRRNISSFSMDVAWVIDQPELQKEDEPACFVGILKLDHIDLTDAPILPPQSEEEEVRNASVLASQLMTP